MIGTLAACVFFQVGLSSHADDSKSQEESAVSSQKQDDTQKPSATASTTNANDAPAVSNPTTTPDADHGATSVAAEAVAVNNNSDVTKAAVETAPSITQTITDAVVSAVSPRPVKLNLIVDGKPRIIEVAAGQMLDKALAEKGITLEKRDRVWPKPNSTKTSDGLKVRIQTVREKLENRTEKIAPSFRIQLTSKLAPGRQQMSSGKAGIATIVEKVLYVGGKRASKTFVSRKVTTPVQDKTLALGTDARFLPQRIAYHKRYARAYQAERHLSARGGSPRDRMVQGSSEVTLRPVRSFIAHTSAYAAGPAGGSIGNYTATGMRCVRGAIAVDPRVIPLGTKLYVEGYGYGFACDTGGAIKGHRLDLAFNSVRECFQHGRRKMKVWILAEDK